MTKYLFSMLAFLFASTTDGYCQDGFIEWDKHYKEVNLSGVLQNEKKYADSIETTLGVNSYYTRTDKYRFNATFLGEKRKMNPQVLGSMKNVFKLFSGSSTQLDGLVENEFLFQTGDVQFWAPVQKQLEKPLNKEIKKGQEVYLYCLFLNEHSSKGLFNTLLVSEFKKE
ncbi:hypothetical protein ACFSC6_13650 [Rufibacter sediminis]|uniref:Uncharacterized protein n=1 Tax=Rufibacter sediminis TaxID=2762756 RepID=A0ABR6VYD0_9BACT|nr:hypothetical protein [Rufibacter sediminis]MBC3542238.1 hypothetical protein [Rufibacter sediminis]